MAEPAVANKDTVCHQELRVTQFVIRICFKSHLSSKLEYLQKNHRSQSMPFLLVAL